MDRSESKDTKSDDADNKSAGKIHEELFDLTKQGLVLSRNELLSNSPARTPGEMFPESRFEKGKIVLGSAAESFLPAAADSLLGVNHVAIPFSKSLTGKESYLPVPRIMETAAVGAAIGFASKVLLPESGILGKVGSAALTAVFAVPLAKQGLDIYGDIKNARSSAELKAAGSELGSALGGFAAGLPVGIASFKAGAYAGESLMASKSMADLAALKGRAYDAAYDWTADKINAAAEISKKAIVGERAYTGSHSIAEEFPRIRDSLKNGIKGTDYALPTVKLDPNIGKGSEVLVVMGHGVEAPEFTEVVRAMKKAGAKVTVATPDWTWDYQPGNRGKVTLAQWLDNGHTMQADISVSAASRLMKEGKFDAMYVPGGAGNTAAIRTDSGVQALVRQSLAQKLDTWTICHGGQVFISALEKGSGIRITGSGDITPQDLPNHGFIVPRDKVVFDANHKLLSGQDPTVLNEFITAIGERFKAIQMNKLARTSNFPTVEQFQASVRSRLDGIINNSVQEGTSVSFAPPPPFKVPDFAPGEFRYPGAPPSYPRGPFLKV